MKTKGTALIANGPTHDALEDLLNAMAVVYDVFPDLWLDKELRYGTKEALRYLELDNCVLHLSPSHACSNTALATPAHYPSQISIMHAGICGQLLGASSCLLCADMTCSGSLWSTLLETLSLGRHQLCLLHTWAF